MSVISQVVHFIIILEILVNKTHPTCPRYDIAVYWANMVVLVDDTYRTSHGVGIKHGVWRMANGEWILAAVPTVQWLPRSLILNYF
jgi:hypothetical protein